MARAVQAVKVGKRGPLARVLGIPADAACTDAGILLIPRPRPVTSVSQVTVPTAASVNWPDKGLGLIELRELRAGVGLTNGRREKSGEGC
jgi:hypothetical protein